MERMEKTRPMMRKRVKSTPIVKSLYLKSESQEKLQTSQIQPHPESKTSTPRLTKRSSLSNLELPIWIDNLLQMTESKQKTKYLKKTLKKQVGKEVEELVGDVGEF